MEILKDVCKGAKNYFNPIKNFKNNEFLSGSVKIVSYFCILPPIIMGSLAAGAGICLGVSSLAHRVKKEFVTSSSKKTDETGLNVIIIPKEPPKEAPKGKAIDEKTEESSETSAEESSETSAEEADVNAVVKANKSIELSPTSKKLLAAYKTDESGWVVVPPKDLLKAEEPFAVAIGPRGYEGEGRWWIDVSIAPSQMEQAIPIIVNVLHRENSPRLGFNMRTKGSLDYPHELGKEFVIIFDKDVENASLRDIQAVRNCLSLLWKELRTAEIYPEPGLVLTPETMDRIENAPAKAGDIEKNNFKRGKFARTIQCPDGSNYFHYRNNDCSPMEDHLTDGLGKHHGVFRASEVRHFARVSPIYAHNPSETPDPFLYLRIQDG